jgi:RHS repeat-associated protein
LVFGRVITNSSGSVVSRHDYKPFGEELGSGTGGRTTGMGFSNSGDNNRKKFTGYKRDTETGLDFAQARYYANLQGRFTSPDPFSASAVTADPQTFNRYAYTNNSPSKSVDPDGTISHPAINITANGHISTAFSCAEADAIIAEDEGRYEAQVKAAFKGVQDYTIVSVMITTDPASGTANGGVPQDTGKTIKDTPPPPIESDPKITACHIKVTFGYLVGEGIGQFGRFMDVDVSVSSGGIKPFRRGGQGNPDGDWTVKQTVESSHTAVGTRRSESKNLARHNDNPNEGVYTINGNMAHWNDAPGFKTSTPRIGRLLRYDGSQQFSIQATNRATTCEVSFGVHSTYRNRTPNIVVIR